MAHFAKLNDSNEVIDVIAVNNSAFSDEASGITFLRNLYGADTNWKQTSYNTWGKKHYTGNLANTENHNVRGESLSSDQSKALRKNFAWIGGTYDATRDAFIPPHKYASWTLNEDTCVYDPPIPMPNDGKYYDWDESAYQSDNTKGWVEIT